METIMTEWVKKAILSPKKQAIPMLFSPVAVLQQVTMKELMYNSDLLAQSMRVLADRPGIGAVFGFSDLSAEAEVFGAPIQFLEEDTAVVANPLYRQASEIERIQIPKVREGRLGIILESLEKAVRLIPDKPVIANVTGPFTLAAQLFDYTQLIYLCYDSPELAHTLLQIVTAFLISYCKECKATGVDAISLGEPAAGMISPSMAETFSVPYVKQMIDAVQDEKLAMIYHNCGNNILKIIDSILSMGAAALHFGNATEIQEILPRVPGHILVMGNLDPVKYFLEGTPELIQEKTNALLDSCGSYSNFIISSGCDVPYFTPWENIDTFLRTAEAYYA